MLSQNQIKHITALKVKKFREEHHQFIAEGHKLVMDMVNSDFSIDGIYASADWIVANLSIIRLKNIPVFETTPREMERISALSTPSPVLAIIQIPSSHHPISTLPHHPISTLPHQHITTSAHQHITTSAHQHISTLTLALDDIRDPGNFGTIIRIADWFGIETVLCSESCVDLYNPKVIQATMGSVARVKVVRCNLAETIQTLTEMAGEPGSPSQLPVYGTFLEGDSVFSQTLSNCGIIVIGNESRGISPELWPLISRKLYIPSFGSSAIGKAESLNASIATAIICAEFRRGELRIEH